MRKFHKLLFGDDAFYTALEPSEAQERALRAAKDKVRDHLRHGIEAASIAILNMDKRVTPRFRTQGSWAYRACVQPDQIPPQEMDWDYGVYLPIEVWSDAGTPKVAADLYFQLVQNLLEGLCRKEGWRMGKEKNHCIRVHIASWAHIDIALYAAPATEFAKVSDREIESIARSANAMDSLHLSREALNEAAEIPEQDWTDFDGMMVATREGHWEKSDAEAIARWFRDQLELKGEQLQRVWRYLKAWRDHQWREGGPSSVLLMLAASQRFEKQFGRDDRALIHVAQFLADAMMNDMHEKGIDGGHNHFNRMNEAERVDAKVKAQALFKAVASARENIMQERETVITLLRAQFGNRIPNRERDVEIESAADYVRAIPARVVPPPPVGQSQSG